MNSMPTSGRSLGPPPASRLILESSGQGCRHPLTCGHLGKTPSLEGGRPKDNPPLSVLEVFPQKMNFRLICTVLLLPLNWLASRNWIAETLEYVELRALPFDCSYVGNPRLY